MRKVFAVSVTAIALVSLLSGTVLAADGSGIRPSAMASSISAGDRLMKGISTMADGSGIRPTMYVSTMADGSGIRPD